MRRIDVALFCAALTVGQPLSAQLLPKLDSAALVRVTAPDRDLRAQLAQVVTQRSDTLWIRRVRDNEVMSLMTREITRLEVSDGVRNYFLRGTGIGLLAGAAVGGGLGYAFPSRAENCFFCGNRGLDAGAGAVAGGIVGALVGGGIGAAHRTEQWRLVVAGPMPIASAPFPKSVQFGVRLGRAF